MYIAKPVDDGYMLYVIGKSIGPDGNEQESLLPISPIPISEESLQAQIEELQKRMDAIRAAKGGADVATQVTAMKAKTILPPKEITNGNIGG